MRRLPFAPALAVALAAASLAVPAAHAEEVPPHHGPAPTLASVQVDGTYQVRRTTVPDVDTPVFGAADLLVPQGEPGEVFGGVVVAPGWAATREKVAWVANRLASHGFVVLLIDPTWTGDLPPARERAMRSALDWLVETPLVGAELDRERLGVWGFSMGGGGALRVAQADPTLKAALAICPWSVIKDYSATTVPSLVLAAQKDAVAPNDLNSRPIYASLTKVSERGWVELAGAQHTVAESPDGRVSALTVSWFKREIDADHRYDGVLCEAVADPGVSRSTTTVCPAP